MSKHTPTPWVSNGPDETLILGPSREIVATTLQDEDDYQLNYDRRAADAELIVRAVNSHSDALVALREAYAVLAFCFQRIEPSSRARDCELCRDIGKARGRIESVLAKAEGRS